MVVGVQFGCVWYLVLPQTQISVIFYEQIAYGLNLKLITQEVLELMYMLVMSSGGWNNGNVGIGLIRLTTSPDFNLDVESGVLLQLLELILLLLVNLQDYFLIQQEENIELVLHLLIITFGFMMEQPEELLDIDL